MITRAKAACNSRSPNGNKVEVFAKDLNFPTSTAFLGNKEHFQVFVIDSGLGLPSRCNDHTAYGGAHNPNDPFTPEVKIFDRYGTLLRGRIGKDTGGFQTEGPALGLAFEKDLHGGTLFASDSNQGLRREAAATTPPASSLSIPIGTR